MGISKKSFLLLVLILFSCLFVSAQSKFLIGKWVMSKSIDNENSIVCNVCPIIEFKDDFTVIIKYPDKTQEKCVWKIEEEENLSFTDCKAKKSSFFNDKYIISFTDDNGIIISDENGKRIYMFDRQ